MANSSTTQGHVNVGAGPAGLPPQELRLSFPPRPGTAQGFASVLHDGGAAELPLRAGTGVQALPGAGRPPS